MTETTFYALAKTASGTEIGKIKVTVETDFILLEGDTLILQEEAEDD